MEILNRREQIKAAAIPPEIANPSTLVTTSDKATKSKAGIVKIGDGINVSNGVISVSNSGGVIFTIPSSLEQLKVADYEMTADDITAFNNLVPVIGTTPVTFALKESADNTKPVFYSATAECGETDILVMFVTSYPSNAPFIISFGVSENEGYVTYEAY